MSVHCWFGCVDCLQLEKIVAHTLQGKKILKNYTDHKKVNFPLGIYEIQLTSITA